MWHLNRARRDSSRPIPVNVVAIEAFYSRHDSREAPGMKDMVIIRTAGFKEMKQKWHLLYKLREVYAMFWEEHGNNVGFSTFCNIRLVNVLLSRRTARDMCLCQTHANFISLTNALLPTYNRQWSVENADCRFEEGCMLNQCATCKDGTQLKEALQGKQVSGDEVEVSRWQKATDDDRLKKIKLIMPVGDAVEVILDALTAFLCHVYVKRRQEVAYQQEIEEARRQDV